ncbi:MAG: hypothetical protein ACFB15_16530 [Cyclobacteriaceae bacterium]
MKSGYNKIVAGIIALVLSALVIPISLLAQDTRTSIEKRLNVSNLHINNVSDESLQPGCHISETLVIQPEVTYSTTGVRATYETDIINLAGE